MRISRKKRPKKPLIPRFNVNQHIKADEVRVLNHEYENLGVFPLQTALQMAQEAELDLVEINPKAEPPVAQIIDFAHFKYQKTKEARKQKTKSKVSEVKGIRLSIRIGMHDLEIRRKQAEKFLSKGNKVKIEIILRGAEKTKGFMADEKIKEFYALLAENMSVKFEQEPTRQGHKVSALIVKS